MPHEVRIGCTAVQAAQAAALRPSQQVVQPSRRIVGDCGPSDWRRQAWRVTSPLPRGPCSRRDRDGSGLCPATRQQAMRKASTQAGPSRTPSSSNGNNPYPLPTTSTASPYDVFHLPRNASRAEIKSRYYDLVKIYHPDRVLAQADGTSADSDSGDGTTDDAAQSAAPAAQAPAPPVTARVTPQQAHNNFKRVRDAYTLLGNESRRRTFDSSGFGWDPTGQSDVADAGDGGAGAPPSWTGGFPRTPQEWAAYERWSASLRRGSPGSLHRRGWEFRGSPGPGGGGGHDRFGWQHYAGDRANSGSDWFYGYGHAHQHANTGSEPLYMANHRFFLSVSLLTAILAVGQYVRLREESRTVINVADRRHQDAARSLDEARRFARSDLGRVRLDEMRRRRAAMAAESAGSGTTMHDGPAGGALVPYEDEPIGRGGPSGKEAYEERMRRIGKM